VKRAPLSLSLHLILGFLPVALCLGSGPTAFGGATNSPIVFNRDIRPILSDNCLPCHGPDANKRKGNLRLDTPEGAAAVHEGRQALKPGDLAASELWRRVQTPDPKLIMPPPDSGRKLKAGQMTLLKRWIENGGAYQKHWAFEPPTPPSVPVVKQADWAHNDIDRFVLAALEEKGLPASGPGSKEALIRRVTLDLIGLPPTLAEVDAFLADQSPDAYEKVVDRLLASSHYGEHMARYWLDLARYGDTHGLHLDNERSIWAYRDWVVDAFNRDLPFDRFTIWQLAGDLLPTPTREQLIASGYNRCNISTSEGGAIDEEFQVRYAIDRVETTSTTWMGLTMGCAVCHDHKLDPITQKEFYQVFALFNNIAENAMDGNALLPPPSLPLPTPEQEQAMKDLDRRHQDLEAKLQHVVAGLKYVDPATLTNRPAPEPKESTWIEDEFPRGSLAKVNDNNETNRWVARSEGPVFSGDRAIRRSGKGLHQVFFDGCDEPLSIKSGDRLFAYVFVDPKDPPKAIMVQYHLKDWNTRANWGDEDAIAYGKKGTTEKVQMGGLPEAGKWVRLEVPAARLGLRPGSRITGLAFTQFDGTAYWDKAGLVTVDDPAQDPSLSLIAWQKQERLLGDQASGPKPIKELTKRDPSELAEADWNKLREHFLTAVYCDPGSELAPIRAEMKSAKDKRAEVEASLASTMISKELEKPRPTWVLVRGQYDKHGEQVGPGVPAVLPPLPASEVTNRLTFARWLMDPKHPLTARVTVNRYWQHFFGVGIVKTSEDFGTKGEWPSNPDLLDWLATEFIRSDWDVKRLVRRIVTSATYRQDSRVAPAVLAADPENRLLARGPRYRLDAEVLRDYALDVSGLINLKLGGRGVRTYQPPGIWEAVGYTASNTAKYSQDHGDALYRRSLYLFWKRTAPPPAMTTFDAPSREKCRARRERTNTPLQALVTMNDPQYVEAARQLAYRLLQEQCSDLDRLKKGFRLVTARNANPQECTVLQETLAAQRARYQADPEAAQKLITVGESPAPKDAVATDLAAYTMMANLLLNLDEAVTKN
jgi:hypothetical protein